MWTCRERISRCWWWPGFPSPTRRSPSWRLRLSGLRAQGKNEFRELFLPLALLKLRQGLGRLVRTPTDRGLILITDPRLTSRPYRM
ncbi:MAG: helicase C-terminal domain-containing protein, partial [Candidatus Bipolaricaulaceae bacterium]